MIVFRISRFLKSKVGFAVLLIVFLLQTGYTQENTAQYEIKTTIGNFQFKAFRDADFKELTGDDFERYYFRLVQFYEIPSDVQRKEWESQGMIIADYLSANTYYVSIDKQFPINSLKGFVRAISPIDIEFKKEASLFFKGIPDHAKKADNKAQFVLSYFKSIRYDAVINDLKSKGVQVLEHREYSCQMDVLIELDQLDVITALPYVQFIGAQSEAPVSELYDYRNSTARSNFLNSGYNGLNYNGSGVVIGIGEDGSIISNMDVKGRVIEIGTSGVPGDHKIGCSENAGGAGNIDPSNKNNAWGTTILSLAGGPDYSGLYASHNLRYTNHSYGYSISGGYDSSARNHDLRIAALPNHLVSYSSGNSGTDVGFAPFNFAGWSNITGQVKQNKNQIAIGSLLANDQIAGFSSRGPMYDGRIVPQLVVEGGEGTSYASPKVVGDMAILAQVYKEKNAGTEPASSLLRAVIMNTADDLGNSGPDYIHGYGRPNLRRAYQVINSNQVITGSVANGVTNNHSVVIPANIRQVRAMVVWPDVAAAVNANPAIVNNLNLSLKSPSLASYNPWVLNSTANVASISAPAIRAVDNINTIEQVTVDNPASGTWTIAINGFNVPSGPQTYFLAYEFLSDELQMAYPLENEKLVSGQQYYLRWDSYGDSGTFNLSYELNNSNTWVTIVNGYDASSRVYQWIAPTVSGGIKNIKFRVQRGALSAVSGSNQIGKTPDNFRIAKVCNDIVTLKWSPVANATSYKIYRLGTKYMEAVDSNITFSGSSATLTGQSTTSSEYYAVSAVTNAIEGQRTFAIEKVPGDANCNGISWTGTISNDWFNAGNWSSGALPTAIDNVSILSSAPFQPVIAAAGAVCGGITINSGATLGMSGVTAYTLSVNNDWINNGTFSRGIGTVDFAATNAYQEIGGSSTTNFNILKVTKGARGNILEANAVITLNATTNPLSLISGTFKLSSNSNITPFTVSTSLSGLMGIWNNGGTINFGNFSWFLNSGLLRVSAGTINLGTSANNTVTYLNNPTLIVEGGTLNVAGRISPNSDASSCTTIITDGTIVVNKFGSTSTTRAPFEMGINTNFTFTGGTLIVQNASSNAADYVNLATTNVVTGGTLQIGNASTAANQVIRINSKTPIYNLTVNAFNTPKAQLVTNNLTIKNDMLIAGGTFDANGLDTTLKGNWTNNGIFIASTGKVVFDGVINQKINGLITTTFKGLTLNNSFGLTLDGNVSAYVNDVLTLTNGVITTGNNKLVVSANGSVARTQGHIFGNLQKPFSPAALNANFEIGDQTVAGYTPVQINFTSVATGGNITITTKIGDHPSLATSTLIQNKSVNRYWTLQSNGVVFSNYRATFNFLPSDLDPNANTGNLKAGNFISSWSYPAVESANNNNVVVTGLTSFGNFQLAENCVNTSSTQTISACGSYTWPINNQTYNQSGNYVATTVSADGCITDNNLALTITPNTGSTTTITANSAYVWSVNDVTYSQSGTYTYINGCDTATLILTIDPCVDYTPTISADGPIAICTAGSVTLTSSSGSSYLWSNGATSQNITVSSPGTYTVVVTDGNGCQSNPSAAVEVTQKITTWTGSGWSNGAPDATTTAIISSDYTSEGNGNGNLNACALFVTGNAQVVIASGDDFNISEMINVAPMATLTINDKANLLQSPSATANNNLGQVSIARTVKLRRGDYVYYGTPVADQNLQGFSPNTLSNRFYTIDEPTSTFVNINAPANVTMLAPNGYVIRAPNNLPNYNIFEAPQTFYGEYYGIPNNGTYTITSTFSAVNKGFNLMGNPYPSAISAMSFLEANPGTVYFWTHTAQGAGSGANYASFNTFGATRASVTVGTPQIQYQSDIPDGVIGIGQGFIYRPQEAGTVSFMNSMRVGNNVGQFFRTADTAEKSRFWMTLSGDASSNQVLLGYMQGATDEFDVSIDGPQIQNGAGISSIIGNTHYVIQGRSLPFDPNDIVPLGLNVDVDGTYTLAIDEVDGLFADGQDIYLRDNQLMIVHDIKANPYTFTASQGIDNTRFEILYQNNVLGIGDPGFDGNSIAVFKDNGLIHIDAGIQKFVDVKVFDVSGRLIFGKSDINTNSTILNDLNAEQQVLLIQIRMENNSIVTKKVVF